MLTAALFLCSYILGCFLALARHPIYGLITYVGLIYVHPPVQWWGKNLPSLRWSLIAAIITLIAVVLHKPVRKKPAFYEFGFLKGFFLFLIWIYAQYVWALDKDMHLELMILMSKYALLIVLLYTCIDSKAQLKAILWAHSLGCFYLGFIVFREYLGGRFEGFEAPGIGEANAAAMLLVSGILTTFILFLSGKWFSKLISILTMPFIVNALVATISRSGFLALGVAGLVFNLSVPKKSKVVVRVLSVAGLVLFISLSNPVYWDRIGTILYAGESVEDVDTGAKRLVLIQAQIQMFKEYPLGCGHRCTVVLSRDYLEDQYLTGSDDYRGRASHNTFMTLLVEQGIPGAIAYILLIVWMTKLGFRLRKTMSRRDGLLPYCYAATISILAAVSVGDMFVDYLKFEPRIWFLALLLILLRKDAEFSKEDSSGDVEIAPKVRADAKVPGTRMRPASQ